jgi:hypothetical protein
MDTAVWIVAALLAALFSVFGIEPALVPLAAVDLALTMVGATVTHVRLGETDRLADRRTRTCAVRRRRGLLRLPPLSTP